MDVDEYAAACIAACVETFRQRTEGLAAVVKALLPSGDGVPHYTKLTFCTHRGLGYSAYICWKLHCGSLFIVECNEEEVIAYTVRINYVCGKKCTCNADRKRETWSLLQYTPAEVAPQIGAALLKTCQPAAGDHKRKEKAKDKDEEEQFLDDLWCDYDAIIADKRDHKRKHDEEKATEKEEEEERSAEQQHIDDMWSDYNAIVTDNCADFV